MEGAWPDILTNDPAGGKFDNKSNNKKIQEVRRECQLARTTAALLFPPF